MLPPPPDAGLRRRYLAHRYDDDGTWALHARLDGLDGALVEAALRLAGDQLFRLRYGDDADPALRQRVSATDALVHLANVALDAMDPATRNHPQRMPSERYLVNIHIDAEHPERASIHLGPTLPPELRRELTCDTTIRAWITDCCGNIGLGRTHRVVDTKLRTALEWRDRSCRVPGCTNNRWLHAHHLTHWEDGGPTELHNLALVCPAHHRHIHRGDLHVTGNANATLTWTTRNRKPLTATPPNPPPTPLHHAATTAGLTPNWTNRTGEHLNWRYIDWLLHPTTTGTPTTPPDTGTAHPSRTERHHDHTGNTRRAAPNPGTAPPPPTDTTGAPRAPRHTEPAGPADTTGTTTTGPEPGSSPDHATTPPPTDNPTTSTDADTDVADTTGSSGVASDYVGWIIDDNDNLTWHGPTWADHEPDPTWPNPWPTPWSHTETDDDPDNVNTS